MLIMEGRLGKLCTEVHFILGSKKESCASHQLPGVIQSDQKYKGQDGSNSKAFIFNVGTVVRVSTQAHYGDKVSLPLNITQQS